MSTYSRWAPFYDLTRRPFAWLTPRVHARVDELLASAEGLTAGGTTVLDLGAGSGFLLRRLRSLEIPFGRYTGIDACPEMLREAQRITGGTVAGGSVELVRGSVEAEVSRRAASGEKFDLIVSSLLLAHLESPASTVAQSMQLLQPSGSAGFLFFADDGATALRPLVRWFLRVLGAQPVPVKEVVAAIHDARSDCDVGALIVERSLWGNLVLVALKPKR